GFPDRERAEDEGAVRDRFVAGRARAALEGARAAGGERGFGGVVHGRTRLGTRSLAWGRKGVIRGAMAARDGAGLAAVDTGIATRQVKHLILDPLKEPEPWRNPSSAPSASAAIAAQNSTISARIQSSARNATPSWSSRRSTRGRDRSPRPLPTPPRRRRKKRWWRRRPPRPNSSRSRKRTRSPRARRPPRARRSRVPRKRWRSKTRAWTTPPSSRSRRRATRTSPISSGAATTRRKREAGSSRLSRQAFSWSGRGRLVTIHFKLRTRSSRHRVPRGAIAQLGERLNGIQEVRGSTPLGSTN